MYLQKIVSLLYQVLLNFQKSGYQILHEREKRQRGDSAGWTKVLFLVIHLPLMSRTGVRRCAPQNCSNCTRGRRSWYQISITWDVDPSLRLYILYYLYLCYCKFEHQSQTRQRPPLIFYCPPSPFISSVSSRLFLRDMTGVNKVLRVVFSQLTWLSTIWSIK